MAKHPQPRRGRPVAADAEHRRVATAMRTYIQEGRWKGGSILPSLRSLARKFNASFGTVRLAVGVLKQERRLKRNAWRRLVVRDLDSPMDGRDTILVVLTRPLSGLGALTAELLKGIAMGAGTLGVPFTVVHGFHFQHTVPIPFLAQPLKGLVLAGRFTRGCLAAYARLPVKVVLADYPSADSRLGSVCVNNFEAARDATARLIQAGHRHIAFVRRILYTINDVDPDSRERQEGFMRAFRDAGLRLNLESMFNVLPEHGSPTYLVNGIFAAQARYTAALCVDPEIAELVQRAAISAARRIPRDFSLVCFHGRHDLSHFSGPETDFAEIGRKAVLHLSEVAPSRCERVTPVWKDRDSFSPVLTSRK